MIDPVQAEVPDAPAAFTPQYYDDVHSFGARMRERGPVYRAVFPDGVPVWVLTGYADVRAALTDPRLAKNRARMIEVVTAKLAERGITAELSALYTPHMLLADPPDHTRLRTLLASAFTARRVTALRPRMAQIAAELLDNLPVSGPVDLVAGYALPLPATVIAELLGVPVADRADFQGWASAMIEQRPEVSLPASQSMVGYLNNLLAEKSAHPGDDLLSALAGATAAGERLRQDELLATTLLLLIAGHETTANLIGNGLARLLADPGLAGRLRAEPALLRPSVEELLRFDSPVMISTNRYSAAEVSYGGVTIPAGEVVLLSLGSANRDPARFDRPDELLPGRDTAGHLAFGHGIHYCIGAPLARLEAEIALSALLTRFPRARPAVPLTALRRRTASIMNGYAALPAVLDP